MKEAITNQLTSLLKANGALPSHGKQSPKIKIAPQINVSINNNVNNYCIDGVHFHTRSRSKCSRENSAEPAKKSDAKQKWNVL